MRITWLILLFTVVAGAVMYYVWNRQQGNRNYDTVSIRKTPDSLQKQLTLFLADNPAEVLFKNNTWMQQDSVPLKVIPLDKKNRIFDKQYRSITFYLVYNNQYFYDVEVNKSDTSKSYDINFEVNKVHDTLYVQGSIDDRHNNILQFAGPMLKMYTSFLLTYSGKLPDMPDSLSTPASKAAKTITVIEN